MTVNMTPRPSNWEFRWFVKLLRDLKHLHHLELERECEDAIRWLCREMKEGAGSLPVRTLTLPCGGGQVLGLKRLADADGLTARFIHIPDPGAHEGGEVGTNPEGSVTGRKGRSVRGDSNAGPEP